MCYPGNSLIVDDLGQATPGVSLPRDDAVAQDAPACGSAVPRGFIRLRLQFREWVF